MNHSYKSSNSLLVVSLKPFIKSSHIAMSTSVPVIVPPVPTRLMLPNNSPLLFSKLNDASLQCVCINDGGGIDDESFESVKTMVNQLLQEKYSHKSSFELW